MRGMENVTLEHAKLVVALSFAALFVDAVAVSLMASAFGIVFWHRSWDAAMRNTGIGKRSLAHRLMKYGA
jgi:hypothetical protein